ncbi:transglutaminase-like putative cysteine protease [Rheinheimera pacifica]|uniref:transglutaminase family protein n=1 Tax=Rheinheimera pacifica TaxID=173990 RepID=UPI0028546906|nr:transglutaminase family protein [Rheinheimera pacifica]MDR6982534.1 transglutaminase-like putative cysteine protease [Rheinheimera pacifica]
MKYQLIHQTEYRYAQTVANSYNLAWLTPRQLPYQQVEHCSLSVNPAPSLIQQRSDSFGNTQHFIHVQPPHKQLRVTSRSTLQVRPRHNILKIRDATDCNGLFAHLRRHIDATTLDALLCQHASRMIPLLPAAKALIMPLMQPGQNILQLAQALNQLIFTEFQYDPEFSTVVTPLSEVLAHKRGVCQDFAQLAISCLRCVGIPARYVSGYLETRPPEGQPRLVGADASHAWFAVFEPTLGWIDFDPTNNILADEQHLTLAWGRDYADVVPLKGILHGNGEHQLSVAVDVVPLAE